MSDKVEYDWDKVTTRTAVETSRSCRIVVKRQPIPIIFVPGIMGTRLRRVEDGEPVWNPDVEQEMPDGIFSKIGQLWSQRSEIKFAMALAFKGAIQRRRLLIGDDGAQFDSGYLEPMDDEGDGDATNDGTASLLKASYGPILGELRFEGNYGELTKGFEFPVYGFGYNWTDSCKRNGEKLSERIDAILGQHEHCEHVILVTHSMGGLVSRAATTHRKHENILGIVHGVQPVTGSPVAYWRMKAGFEEGGAVGKLLGKSGREVTVILGNSPGGLELLPSKEYPSPWLHLVRDGSDRRKLPHGDPYAEIYREKDAYWRAVDEDLLDPSRTVGEEPPLDPDEPEADTGFKRGPWEEYLKWLAQAEEFHEWVSGEMHPETYTLHGAELETAASATMVELEWPNPTGRGNPSRYRRQDQYTTRGFNSFCKDDSGTEIWARLLDREGDGDGTVPVDSATALDEGAKRTLRIPGGGHEPIYKNDDAQNFTISSIVNLCLEHKLDKV